MKHFKNTQGFAVESVVSEKVITMANKTTLVTETASTTLEEQKTNNSNGSEILETSRSASIRISETNDELTIAAFLVDIVGFIVLKKSKKAVTENEVDNCCFS